MNKRLARIVDAGERVRRDVEDEAAVWPTSAGRRPGDVTIGLGEDAMFLPLARNPMQWSRNWRSGPPQRRGVTRARPLRWPEGVGMA